MQKELIGIGMNPDLPEGHIHLVAKSEAKTGVAFCDKRTKGMIVQKTLTAADVTCKKCMEYRAFKEMIDPSKAKSPPDKDKLPKKAAPKKKAPKKKAEAKKTETPKKKKVEPYIDFAAVPNSDGTYKVKHIPSERNFFDNIPANVIAFALDALNSLDVRWKKGDKLPENYVSLVRDTIKQVYKERKTRPPKHLTRPVKKQKKKRPPKAPKGVKKGDQERQEGIMMEWNGQRWMRVQRRVIKRRKPKDEKAKRTIKRRDKAEPKEKRQIKRRETMAGLNQYGQVLDKPPALIAAHLGKGAHLDAIITDLQDKFGMTEKRAMSKFRAITRKMARRLGITITHIIMGDPSNDYYHIADDDE